MLWLGLVQPETSYLILLPGMILGGLGAGLCLISFTKEAVASLGDDKVGLASGLYNMLRFTGSSLSTPILGIILAANYGRYTGGETASGPYQFCFLVLTITTIVGIIVAASIPSPLSYSGGGKKRSS